MQFGPPGNGKADVQVTLERFQLRAGIFEHRKLGERGIACGYDGRTQTIGLGLWMLDQEPVVAHGGKDRVAGRLVQI